MEVFVVLDVEEWPQFDDGAASLGGRKGARLGCATEADGGLGDGSVAAPIDLNRAPRFVAPVEIDLAVVVTNSDKHVVNDAACFSRCPGAC